MDKFIGPGATKAEILLQFVPAVLFGLAVVFYAYENKLGWQWYQYLAGGLLGLDIMGGIITNATSAAKRWYHREGQGFTQHFTFILIHIFQIGIAGWLFYDWNLKFIAYAYGFLVAASLIILSIPQYLQRPAAMLTTAIGILLAIYAIPMAPGMEWFVPLLYMKLLISHLLKEEPYRAK